MGASLTYGEGLVRGYCGRCDEWQTWPNTAAGRTFSFAWLTRHDNHIPSTTPAPRLRVPEPDSEGGAS